MYYIANSNISQTCYIVGLKRGKIDALWDVIFCIPFNSNFMKSMIFCYLLLFSINLVTFFSTLLVDILQSQSFKNVMSCIISYLYSNVYVFHMYHISISNTFINLNVCLNVNNIHVLCGSNWR